MRFSSFPSASAYSAFSARLPAISAHGSVQRTRSRFGVVVATCLLCCTLLFSLSALPDKPCFSCRITLPCFDYLYPTSGSERTCYHMWNLAVGGEVIRPYGLVRGLRGSWWAGCHYRSIDRTSGSSDTGAEYCRLRGRLCPIGHPRLRLGRLYERLRQWHKLGGLQRGSRRGRSGGCDGHSLPTGFPEITFASNPFFAWNSACVFAMPFLMAQWFGPRTLPCFYRSASWRLM